MCLSSYLPLYILQLRQQMAEIIIVYKFYRQYYDLISKFQIGLKSLLHKGLSEPNFYGDLVYKMKKIVGSNNFSEYIKIISHYKKDWL